jgi:POT family proton-dependent oligopeptide transporter
MASSHYRTEPLPITGMPPGIGYIVGNEAAERFSFYGMRGILVVFMTKYLMNHDGELDLMTAEQAKSWFHLFMMGVYFFPVLGSLLSDGLLGKYRTIIWLSLVYCAGHAALAIDDTRLGLALGLILIALGSGGIKPCVSANVGDQFGPSNKHLLEKVYAWFYFSINFGSLFSTLLIPYLLAEHGPKWAFGVPGVFMAIATVIFWLGRHKFAHRPAGGIGFLREAFGPEGRSVILSLAGLYAFVAIFWALYDQTGSAWILQADKMDLNWFGIQLKAAQTHTANPIMILAFIPLFAYVIYPALEKVLVLTPLRKLGIGFLLTAASFCLSALIESWIQAGQRPHINWQFLAYAVMTAGEVMVSITGLEFSYTQAPPKMKSLVMSLWLLAVAAGNFLTAMINILIQDEAGNSRISGTNYYLFFAGLMGATAVVFALVASRYRYRSYLQSGAEATAEGAAEGA